jgi:hypothetical protein
MLIVALVAVVALGASAMARPSVSVERLCSAVVVVLVVVERPPAMGTRQEQPVDKFYMATHPAVLVV